MAPPSRSAMMISNRAMPFLARFGTRALKNDCEPQRHRDFAEDAELRDSTHRESLVVERAEIGSLERLSVPLWLCGLQFFSARIRSSDSHSPEQSPRLLL